LNASAWRWQHDQVELRPSYPVRSRRLLLRPLRPSDADALAAYRALPEVCRYVPFEPMNAGRIARRLAGDWARTALDAEGQGLTLGVELAGSGDLVGDVVLFWHSREHRGGEIGYVFNPGSGGRGYATEAAHALLHLAFDQLGLHRVIARIDARNDASARLAARLGMRQEARLVRNEWFKGEWSDELDFALLEDEWLAQHQEGSPPCGGRPDGVSASDPPWPPPR
jgi:RimJ/RimL family protein N-acetyltransferase